MTQANIANLTLYVAGSVRLATGDFIELYFRGANTAGGTAVTTASFEGFLMSVL